MSKELFAICNDVAQLDIDMDVLFSTLNAIYCAMTDGPNAPETYFNALYGANDMALCIGKRLKDIEKRLNETEKALSQHKA